jgi:hypothetical protein
MTWRPNNVKKMQIFFWNFHWENSRKTRICVCCFFWHHNSHSRIDFQSQSVEVGVCSFLDRSQSLPLLWHVALLQSLRSAWNRFRRYVFRLIFVQCQLQRVETLSTPYFLLVKCWLGFFAGSSKSLDLQPLQIHIEQSVLLSHYFLLKICPSNSRNGIDSEYSCDLRNTKLTVAKTHRTETDTMGSIQVESTKYWGAQTQRQVQHCLSL